MCCRNQNLSLLKRFAIVTIICIIHISLFYCLNRIGKIYDTIICKDYEVYESRFNKGNLVDYSKYVFVVDLAP